MKLADTCSLEEVSATSVENLVIRARLSVVAPAV